MGDRFSKATGLTFAAFVALMVGLQWEPFFKGLSAFPEFVQALAHGLPFGFWSCLLALVLGMGAWGFCYLHVTVCASKPHSCADWAAVLMGVGVNMTQQWAGGDASPTGVMLAFFLGLFSGFSAMFLARLLWSFLSPPKEPTP